MFVNSLRAARFAGSGGVIRVTAEDGANLALKHYRPAPGAALNTGGVPVLLMPGAIANFNEFVVSAPDGKDRGAVLPRTVPDWAEGDIHIRKDPLKLYSLAYYLHSRGHDVWLVNFRGQGRAAERSLGLTGMDIDHFGLCDMKAAVETVRKTTGMRPVYIGHSLGGVMALMYFQGARFTKGKGGKIESDPRLVEERNAGEGPQAVRGFVNLDGPCVPNLLGNGKLPHATRFVWHATALPFYFNLKVITRFLPRGTGKSAKRAFSALWNSRHRLPAGIEKAISVLFMVNPENIDPEVLENVVKYGVDGVPAHAAWQLMDAALCGRLRSFYRGFGGERCKEVPPADGTGGIYCYSDNMDKVSVPSLFLADATVDITRPGETRNSYDAKKRHPLDEFRVMPGTAHIDLVIGLRAPFETYPAIGAWIDKLGPE